MYPDNFILALDMHEEIQRITDICLQRHYILNNDDFRDIVNFSVRTINTNGDVPGLDSRIDTFISTVLCFVETNFVIPGIDNSTTYAILSELETLLMQELTAFNYKFLDLMQKRYNLIRVDHMGYLSTNYQFEILEVHSYGSCNIKVTKVKGF